MATPKQKEWFLKITEYAKKHGAKYPEMVAAHLANESGYGKSRAGTNYNIAGIKYHGPTAKRLTEQGFVITKGVPTEDKVTGSTDEYMDFENEEAAVAAYLAFLETNPRYEKALNAETPEEFVYELGNAGYWEGDVKKHGTPEKAKKAVADTLINIAKTNTGNKDLKVSSDYLKEQGEEIKSNNKKRKEDYTGTWKGEGRRPQSMIDEREKIENDYVSKITEINSDQSLTPIQKKEAIENYHKELYQKGDLGIVETFVDEENQKRKKFTEEYPEWDSMTEDQKKEQLSKMGSANPTNKKMTEAEKKQAYEDLRSNLAQDRFNIPTGSTFRGVNLSYEYPSASLDYYDNLYDSENVTTSSTDSTDESETKTEPDTTYSDMVEGYKGSSQVPDKETEEDPNAFLQAFGYTAPNETMTFDTESSWTDYLGMAGSAAMNLSMGIAGMKAANEEAPERDEDISEALLNYAAEQKKISQMGLDPAVEADLKMKLNSAYQFGMENIVRASAGNRNLVLGNQGQLDQAKMQGAMQIALMDVERRDRAMQAYGQVLEYINEFDTRKDIANNERKYREFEKRQGAGMALAEKGFSNLISDLEHQLENRKGGPNDLMRRKLLSSIMGYDPYAKDDGSGTKIGTKSHAEKIASENREKAEDAKQGRAFFNSLDDEGKKEAYKYLKENSQLNPSVNPDARFSGFIEAFNNRKGSPISYGPVDTSIIIPDSITDVDEREAYLKAESERITQERMNTPGEWWNNGSPELSAYKSKANPTGQSRFNQSRFNQSRFGGFDAIDSFGLNDKKDPYNLLEKQLFKDINEQIEERKAFNRY